MSDWLPIATAPKDGTEILILRPNRTMRIARWHRGGWHTIPSAYHTEATRWMPLPDTDASGEKAGLAQTART